MPKVSDRYGAGDRHAADRLPLHRVAVGRLGPLEQERIGGALSVADAERARAAAAPEEQREERGAEEPSRAALRWSVSSA